MKVNESTSTLVLFRIQVRVHMFIQQRGGVAILPNEIDNIRIEVGVPGPCHGVAVNSIADAADVVLRVARGYASCVLVGRGRVIDVRTERSLLWIPCGVRLGSRKGGKDEECDADVMFHLNLIIRRLREFVKSFKIERFSLTACGLALVG